MHLVVGVRRAAAEVHGLHRQRLLGKRRRGDSHQEERQDAGEQVQPGSRRSVPGPDRVTLEDSLD